MLRNNNLRAAVIVLAIIFVILLTFAYGNYLRQPKSGQNKPSNQSVQNSDKDKNKTADKNTKNKTVDNKKSTDSSNASSPSQSPTNRLPVSNSPGQPVSTPTTGAGDAILPLSVLGFLTVEYIRVRFRRRSLQASISRVE